MFLHNRMRIYLTRLTLWRTRFCTTRWWLISTALLCGELYSQRDKHLFLQVDFVVNEILQSKMSTYFNTDFVEYEILQQDEPLFQHCANLRRTRFYSKMSTCLFQQVNFVENEILHSKISTYLSRSTLCNMRTYFSSLTLWRTRFYTGWLCRQHDFMQRDEDSFQRREFSQ